MGSNATIEVQGKKVRGRRYPWGVVEGRLFNTQIYTKTIFTIIFAATFSCLFHVVENPKHSDFVKLRTMLMYVFYKSVKSVS